MIKQIVLTIIVSVIYCNAALGQQKDRSCILKDTLKAMAYVDTADVYYKNADYLKAKINYITALDIYKCLYGYAHRMSYRIYRKLGIVEDDLGNYKESVYIFHKCTEITKVRYGEYSKEVAELYGDLGIEYTKLEKFDSSEYYIKKDEQIQLAVFGENSKGFANCQNNLGIIYLYKGDYDKAIEFFKKALTIRLKVLQPNDISIAQNYNNLARIFYDKGDFDQAIDYQLKALAIEQSTLNEYHPQIAWSYNNLGCCYKEKNDYKKALFYQTKSLTIRLKTLGSDHPDVEASYMNIANIYETLALYDSALYFHKKALDNCIKSLGPNHSDIASIYFNMGVVYYDCHNYDSAVVKYTKAIEINKQVFSKPHPLTADYLTQLAKAYFNVKNLKKSNECLDTALVYNITDSKAANWPDSIMREYVVSHEVMMRILLGKIDLLTQSKTASAEELQEALSYTYEALLEAEKARFEITSENSKLYMGENFYNICNEAINVLYRLYNLTHRSSYITQAFNFSEKSRASVLYESLAGPKALLRAGVPSNVLQKEKSFRSNIVSYETKRKTAPDNESSMHENIDSILFALKSSYRKYLDSISSYYPLASLLMQQTKIANIDEIKQDLATTSAMIEYFTGKEKTFAFVVTPGKSTLIELPVDSSMVSKVKKFLTGIRKNNLDLTYENGTWLYKSLLEPLIPSIKGAKSLIIIPDQILNNIPFEALITGGKKIAPSYFIEKYALTYQISASIWQDKSKSSPGNTTLLSFAGFAPVFKSNQLYAAATHRDGFAERYSQDTTFLDPLRSQQYFKELPNSGEEVTQIAALFKKLNQSADTYTFEQANETAFKNESPKYNILHIATHAYANNDEPELSWLAFANIDSTARTNRDDGVLYAGEIYGLALHANLVVLSACETGVGKMIKGEGVMSLSRSIMYAGVPNIVLSLWKVGDLDTRLLMVEFYKAYLSGKSYSDALRIAKLNLLRKEASGNPKSWAGFVLFGI